MSWSAVWRWMRVACVAGMQRLWTLTVRLRISGCVMGVQQLPPVMMSQHGAHADVRRILDGSAAWAAALYRMQRSVTCCCADVCCEFELDSDRSCCPEGVDACGVCGGDGSGCYGRAVLALFVTPPAATPACDAAAFATPGSWCAVARSDFCRALEQSLAGSAGVEGGLECGVTERGGGSAEGAGRRRLVQVGGGGGDGVMALEVTLQGRRGLFTETALAMLASTAVPGVPWNPIHHACAS